MLSTTEVTHAPSPGDLAPATSGPVAAGGGLLDAIRCAEAADALVRSDRGPTSARLGLRLPAGVRLGLGLAGLSARRPPQGATLDSLLDDVVRATRRLMRAVRAAHASAPRPVGRSRSVVVDDLARQHMREVLRRIGMVPR